MNLTTKSYDVPLERPLETADGTIDRRRGFLVRIADGDDAGVGEAAPLPGWTERRDACERALRRASRADDLDAAVAACDDAPAARHAVALARADLRSQRTATPLYRHLGAGDQVGRIPVNATVGDAPADDTVERARAAVEAGFDCLKLKVGARSVDADVDRVAAVRRAVGTDVALRVDANGSWTRSEAGEALDALAAVDVAYVEQPLPADDLDGLADLSDRNVAVALDETLVGPGLDAAIDAGAGDLAVLKPMALGGPDRAVAAGRRAREAGLEPVVTTTIDAAVARTGAVHVAAALAPLPPCGLATGDALARDVAPDPAPVRDGAAVVPQDPGVGIDAGEVL